MPNIASVVANPNENATELRLPSFFDNFDARAAAANFPSSNWPFFFSSSHPNFGRSIRLYEYGFLISYNFPI